MANALGSVRELIGWRVIMLKRTLTALATLALLAGATPLLSACNTTEGVGEDIEATGAAIDEAAEDAQN